MGLTPGGSSTVHIYTQQYEDIENGKYIITNKWEVQWKSSKYYILRVYVCRFSYPVRKERMTY
jgi:hypothetical protein